MTDKPAKPAQSETRRLQARRKFLQSAALGAGMLGLSAAGILPVLARRQARLRPPGALEEDDFLAACIKCGQCVQVCPVEAIKLADLTDGFGVGVPYIDSRDQACDFSCDAVQCVLACPTGALVYKKPPFLESRPGMKYQAPVLLVAKDKDPELPTAERAGLARLDRPEACLAVKGRGFKGQARGTGFKGKMRFVEVDRWKPIPLRDHPFDVQPCDLCVRTCPIHGAISLDPVTGADGVTRMTPTVHEPCAGCGVCEMVCPVEPAAIVVDARAAWRA
jgi:ferredoxin-type protein NapG